MGRLNWGSPEVPWSIVLLHGGRFFLQKVVFMNVPLSRNPKKELGVWIHYKTLDHNPFLISKYMNLGLVKADQFEVDYNTIVFWKSASEKRIFVTSGQYSAKKNKLPRICDWNKCSNHTKNHWEPIFALETIYIKKIFIKPISRIKRLKNDVVRNSNSMFSIFLFSVLQNCSTCHYCAITQSALENNNISFHKR